MKKYFFIFFILFSSMKSASQCVIVCSGAGGSITPSGSVTICQGDNVTLTAPNAPHNTWTRKTDLTGSGRENGVAFTLGSKGFFGTGKNTASGVLDDFWEFDVVTDTWTQKADFAGGTRWGAVGFVLGSKGYVGTGRSGATYYNDFWEYDVSTNTWTAKAAFTGSARSLAVGFSNCVHGYIGTGWNGTTRFSDFREYDPGTNTWTNKAPFPGAARHSAIGFMAGGNGYIGTGSVDAVTNAKDLYEYDTGTNTWAVRTNFPGLGRYGAAAFTLGTKAFVGLGYNGTTYFNDFYEYDPDNNTWLARANYGGPACQYASAFSTTRKGYFLNGLNTATYNKQIWEYDPARIFLWSNGATTESINVTTGGEYTVTTTHVIFTGGACTSPTSAPTHVVMLEPEVSITPAGAVNICQGSPVSLTAQVSYNNWAQKTDLGGIVRRSAVGFAIGSKGYIGTGTNGISGTYYKDFWEYDPVTDTWTQKADFGGAARHGAVGFGIGNKGYLGTGSDGGHKKDFWEYDPALNVWIQKADFGGVARFAAVGFSIGTKGYIGTGRAGAVNIQDFWEYNPVTDTWIQKADFGGTARYTAVGFSIGTKGYIGTGEDVGGDEKDFWQYDPATNVWIQKADFGGSARSNAVGFSIGAKGFIGTGYNNYFKKDFWEYDPTADSWKTIPDFGGTARYTAVGFSIGTKGYIGTGSDVILRKDFWEFNSAYNYLWSTGASTPSITASASGSYTVTITDANGCSATSTSVETLVNAPQATVTPNGPTTFCAGGSVTLSAPVNNTWIQKTDLAAVSRTRAVGFSIGKKGYIGTGYTGTVHRQDFWEYDPASNAWTQKANFTGGGRQGAVGFSIGSRGYIGTGYTGSLPYKKDFWEYNPITNAWVQKADFGGTARTSAVGFSIGSKGYIGTGGDTGGDKKDFWEYDPATNIWIQKADFGGTIRETAFGLSIGSKGYIGSGYDGTYKKDFWEYDPATNVWIQKADFGGAGRIIPVAFSIGTKGFVFTGYDGATYRKDFWEYDPANNTWLQKVDFSGTERYGAVGFSIGSKGYIGTGRNGPTYYADFWQYDPGNNYTWSTGATTQTITPDTSGTFTVTLTDQLSCAATSSPTAVTVTTTNTWAGGGTNNWNTGSNWSCGIPPNHPKIDAVILNGASPMPVLTADVLVRNLLLNGSATVDLNGRTLTINKNITGTGTLKGSATSNLILKGTTGTINFTTGSQLLKDLLLTDTASATLGTALSIAGGVSPGSVTVNSNAVLTTGGNLTLKSDVSGTSRAGILTGNIIGDVTVERYIHIGTGTGQHAKSWQFLATPTSGQTIRQSWQENGLTPTGFGTIITGTGTGFDITTATPSLKFFNESAVNWTGVTNTNTALQQKLGYMIFVRGDRTVTTSGALANNTILRSKGALFTPFNQPPSIPVSANKFQTFGNPYASRIEFSKVRAASTGINDVFYVWDPQLNGTYNLGGYQTITGATGYIPTVGVPPVGSPATIYYPAGIAAPYIESGQAVFVRGNSTGGNINFNENVKVTGSRLVNRNPSLSDDLSNRRFLFASLFANNGEIADANIVVFENGLGNGQNENDAIKILNPGENFGIMRNDSLLAVEARNDVSENDTIYYNLQNLKQLPYQFRLAPVNMPAILTGYLIDRYANTSTTISMTDSSFINFTITADAASNEADRFILVFRQTSVVPLKIIEITANRNPDQTIMVKWKVENETNIQNYETERSGDGSTFISIGETDPISNSGGGVNYNFKDGQPFSNENYYRIKAKSKDGMILYSSIAKISAKKVNPLIAVYQNPIRDNMIGIRFTNQPKGNYTIRLTNKLGQILYSSSLYIDQTNLITILQPHSILASGAYQLNVLSEHGRSITETVIVP